jgi:hypothetical protein
LRNPPSIWAAVRVTLFPEDASRAFTAPWSVPIPALDANESGSEYPTDMISVLF